MDDIRSDPTRPHCLPGRETMRTLMALGGLLWAVTAMAVPPPPPADPGGDRPKGHKVVQSERDGTHGARRPGQHDASKAGRGHEAAGKNPGAKIPVGKIDQKPHIAPPAVPPVARQPKEPAEPALPVPRFASMKNDETNMRRGPGQRYPIDWIYRRRDLPVRVEREYDVWRLIRDSEGVQGWVHEVTLSEQRRTFVVKDADVTLRDTADDKSHPVAVLKTGVIGRFRSCEAGSHWCQIQVGGYKGYLRRDQVWGLLPDDIVAP